MRKRVIRVAVALHTSKRGSPKYIPGGADPVDNGGYPKLLVLSSALVVIHRVSVETRRNQLILIGQARNRVPVGHQITRELLRQELVIRFITVECLDKPVAIPPDFAARIAFVAFGIGVAGQIEPNTRPFFAVSRRSQHPVNSFPVGIGRFIGQKRRDFFGGRRQTRQIEGHTPEQS